VILLGALALFPIDADDRRAFQAAYGYICFYVAVPTFAFLVLLPKYATPLRMKVGILVALAAATALPDLLYYVIWQPELLSLQFSFRHLMGPLQTVPNWRIVESAGWISFPFAIGAIGLMALVALVPMAARQAAQDALLDPHRPAPAAGETGRAEVTY
jgi:hypothetical protein